MKFFACFKKMNKLGAAMVEYAVILAFVAAVALALLQRTEWLVVLLLLLIKSPM